MMETSCSYKLIISVVDSNPSAYFNIYIPDEANSA